jgi:hypothetical protein
VTQVGDLWLLRDHRVFCGDALDARCYESLMNSERAAMGLLRSTVRRVNRPANCAACTADKEQPGPKLSRRYEELAKSIDETEQDFLAPRGASPSHGGSDTHAAMAILRCGLERGHYRHSNRSLLASGSAAGKKLGEARDRAGIFGGAGRSPATETALSPRQSGMGR